MCWHASHCKTAVEKLQAYGFDGELLAFINDFITGRSQKVVWPNGHSPFMSVLSGVPQRSVLGPLLFLLFANDITDYFTKSLSVKLFADDLKFLWKLRHFRILMCFREVLIVLLTGPVDDSSN